MIKNFAQLAVTPERKKLLKILDHGLEATKTAAIIKNSVALTGEQLAINAHRFDLKKFKNIYVVGIGKAAGESCLELERILGDKISAGYCIDVKFIDLKFVALTVGAHKNIEKKNFSFANAVVSLLHNLKQDDLVIAVISGGGSALFCYPYEAECVQGGEIFKSLTQKGASIYEINTVRKHLSLVKGGGLAKIAYPATVISLLFSDVPGDDLDVIASGPTIKDSSGVEDARSVLKKYGLNDKIKLFETPKQDKYFEKVSNILICSNKITLAAMKKRAAGIKLPVRIFKSDFQADANEAARILLSEARVGELLVAGGETTVKISGEGKGGRNQHVVLAGLNYLQPTDIIISCATDGYDNTEAAGAVGDAQTLSKAQTLGLDTKRYLDRNDSYNFFFNTQDQIITGQTGLNVSDIFLVYKK